MSDRAEINIRDVPQSLRAKIDEDARERDASRNDVVGEILAARYGLKWEASGYPYSEGTESTQMVLRMPHRLKAVIAEHARGVGGTQSGCVLLALESHYGLPTRSPHKRVTAAVDPEIVSAARKLHAEGVSLRELSRQFGIHRPTLTRAIRGEA